jgi:hypothetical protein
MKNFKQFIKESKENLDLVNKVIKYLENEIHCSFYPYGEDFIVHKNNIDLTGKLFLMEDTRAIRINFKKDLLHSIDLWEDFKFDDNKILSNPNFTMLPKSKDVDYYLEDILSFIEGDFGINESEEVGTEFKKSESEYVELKSISFSRKILNEDIDIFDALQYYTRQVIYGISNSLIISGGPGLGKSHEVESILKESRLDYKFFKGDITTAGLYETLFLNNGQLIVFDDCDSVWDNTQSNNLLKAALDTKKEREVSRIIQTHFNSDGMSYEEMLDKNKESGKLPKSFIFTGRCIFITNVDGKEIDSAVVSRSLHVDINLTKEEVIQRLRRITDKIFDKIPNKDKDETLDFVDYLTNNFPTKFPLSIRTMIHALNIRMANDKLKINVRGEELPAWQLLIKQFLIKGK